MIINTSGGSVNTVKKTFTLSSAVVYPNPLTISGVDLPGGIVHGFSLFMVNNESLSKVLNDMEIMYAFADGPLAKIGQFSYALLSVDSDARFNTITTAGLFGFTYDYANKTFTLQQNHTDSKWGAGSYELIVW